MPGSFRCQAKRCNGLSTDAQRVTTGNLLILTPFCSSAGLIGIVGSDPSRKFATVKAFVVKTVTSRS